jgi:hypothetical protein
MNLEFTTKSMEYFKPILREQRTVEETAEAIILDSSPDMTDVLLSSGMAFLRGKELSDGILTVSAGVSAMAICQSDGRSAPEIVEVYIPFSVKIENPQLKPGQNCVVKVQLRRLDGHLVSSRKVMVRANLAITASVYEVVQEEHPEESATPGLQLQKNTAPIRCLVSLGEKNYTVEDSVRFRPEGNAVSLAACQVLLTHTDSRLTSARAVLKGEAELRVLYLDDAGKLQTATASVPFSQYIDLEECQETDELQLRSCLTGADVMPSSDGGGLNVTLQLLTTAEVYRRQELSYIGDIYSLVGQVTPETVEKSYDSLLDQQFFAPVGHGNVPGQYSRIIYADCLPGAFSHQRNGEQVEFTLPLTAQVLLETEDGGLRGAVAGLGLTAATQAAESCRFTLEPEVLTVGGSIGVDGVDIKATGTLSISTYSNMEFTEIVGGELSEEPIKRDGPGLIIRRPSSSETLWDIAKAYRTTIQAIMEANGLEEELISDQMLLIPR